MPTELQHLLKPTGAGPLIKPARQQTVMSSPSKTGLTPTLPDMLKTLMPIACTKILPNSQPTQAHIQVLRIHHISRLMEELFHQTSTHAQFHQGILLFLRPQVLQLTSRISNWRERFPMILLVLPKHYRLQLGL